MKQVQNSQLVFLNSEAFLGGLFAYGMLSDYRSDWALADNLEPLKDLTIYRDIK